MSIPGIFAFHGGYQDPGLHIAGKSTMGQGHNYVLLEKSTLLSSRSQLHLGIWTRMYLHRHVCIWTLGQAGIYLFCHPAGQVILHAGDTSWGRRLGSIGLGWRVLDPTSFPKSEYIKYMLISQTYKRWNFEMICFKKYTVRLNDFAWYMHFEATWVKGSTVPTRS